LASIHRKTNPQPLLRPLLDFQPLRMLDDNIKLQGRSNCLAESAKSDPSPQLPQALETTYSNSRHSRLMSRTRSNNGYGCNGGAEDIMAAVDDRNFEGCGIVVQPLLKCTGTEAITTSQIPEVSLWRGNGSWFSLLVPVRCVCK
jgi:hypothetical protein